MVADADSPSFPEDFREVFWLQEKRNIRARMIKEFFMKTLLGYKVSWQK
jgi:hypothetical protein